MAGRAHDNNEAHHRLMKTILTATLLSLALAAPPLHANEFYQPARLGLTDTEQQNEPEQETDISHERATEALIDHGMGYLGIRYRRGGTSPETGLDCSGLVQNVFRHSLGLQLPRTAADMARLGEKVNKNELLPGDLVFFKTSRRAFSHVGIYVGEGRFLHSPSSGGVVRVESMGKKYWQTRYNGARRLLASNS